MVNNFLRRIKSSLFSRKSSLRMAAASSTGIFLGMLPLIGIRLPIAIIISLIFKLNIIALLLGIALTIIFPAVHLFSFWLGQAFAGYEVPFFSLRFLNFSHLLEWTTSGRYQLVGSIIVGLILSSILLPVFYKFYESKYTKNHQLNVKGFIFYDESGKRWWLTERLGLAFAIIVFIVVSIFGVSLSGPDPQYTTQIMHILDKNNIKATFFIVGENAEINPDIIENNIPPTDDICSFKVHICSIQGNSSWMEQASKKRQRYRNRKRRKLI